MIFNNRFLNEGEQAEAYKAKKEAEEEDFYKKQQEDAKKSWERNQKRSYSAFVKGNGDKDTAMRTKAQDSVDNDLQKHKEQAKKTVDKANDMTDAEFQSAANKAGIHKDIDDLNEREIQKVYSQIHKDENSGASSIRFTPITNPQGDVDAHMRHQRKMEKRSKHNESTIFESVIFIND